MDIRPIKTDEDHRAAPREIEALWGATEGTPEGDRLDGFSAVALQLIEDAHSQHDPNRAR